MKLNNTGFCYLQLVWLLVGTLLLSTAVVAQSPADFQQYKDRYPSHPFIRLQDNAELEITLDKQGKPVLKIKETNKLLVLTDNCDGISELRNYYNSNDEILKTEAYSLVPEDGKYRKITIPAMKKTTETDNNNYFDDSYCMVGHFPAIAKGTVLYNYNEYISHESSFGYNFYFGESAPVETTGITVTVPDNIQLVCRYAGKDTALINYTETKKGTMTTYTWRCDRLKGYYHDQLAPTPRYYRPHLTLNIAGYDFKGKHTNVMGTLDDFCKWEVEKLKNTNLVASPVVRQLADSITQACTTPVEKVKAIYRWVQDKIKYVAIEDGDNGFVPQDATTVIARRYGDCKDKSSLITALLQSVGEKASLACLGTRSLPYTFTRYPMVGSANHLIAIWWDENKRPVPLDGTSRHLSINDVPAFIQGKECLIVKGENDCLVYKIPVDVPESNIKLDTLNLKIDKTRLYGKGLVVLKGEEKSELMYRIEGKNDVQQKDAISEFLDFAGNKLDIKQFSFD
jgi:transglutaminase-like putative cysteine protease